MTLFDELRAVLTALDEATVEYALIGGLAVAVWGAPRATKDIDLLIRPEALDAAKAALRPNGFTLEALPFDFRDSTTVHRINKADRAGNFLTVDLMLVNTGLESAWASRVSLTFAGQRLVVVSRDALMAMKAQAARPQDLMDIQKLREVDG